MTSAAQVHYYVTTNGNDKNSGSLTQPFQSIEYALRQAENQQNKDVTISIRKGTYYLKKTIVINSDKVKAASILLEAFKNESVVISAGRDLDAKWTYFQRGIYRTSIPTSISFERMYVNDSLQVLARYPNYNLDAPIFNGTSENAIAPSRIQKWKNPKGGYIHALQSAEWGSLHYRINGVQNDTLQLEGGWQNNRPGKMHKTALFVENIFEELDTPGEWFLDTIHKYLYYYPTDAQKLKDANIVVSQFKNTIELRGTANRHLSNIIIKGLLFKHNERSFWETKEPLLRSDWTIYRGGVVLLENTQNCKIEDCTFKGVGGNAIFISGNNYKDTVMGCHVSNIGASAICIVGKSDAVRSPVFQYNQYETYQNLDMVKGPRNEDYPKECVITNNLLCDLGKIEKQSAGITIDIAESIKIAHNTIYNVPRAGINIGDGCFGGHLIEYNDVFNTVLETGDHGAFNSWGRDRFWAYKRKYMDSLVFAHPELILLDAFKQTTIRNNRFRCDHGWDIDLDDGSSNYLIENNICLSGGIKLREGFYRIVKNNILFNNTFHPHVWFKNSGDVFQHNIVWRSFAPIGMKYWGKEIDYNFFPDTNSLLSAQKNGTDKNSVVERPYFIDDSIGNFTLLLNSHILALGFRNIATDSFGVEKISLKKLALTPNILSKQKNKTESVGKQIYLLGAELKSIEGLGERSAYGLPDQNGVVIKNFKQDSPFGKSGFKPGDVIRLFDNKEIKTVEDLQYNYNATKWKKEIPIIIIRNQLQMEIKLVTK